MVKKFDSNIMALVSQYLQNLQGKLTIDKVVLFGSYAEERANEHSDIDLAIISPDVKSDNLIECLQLLTRAIPRHINVDIEPLAFSTLEFENASPLEFIGQIKQTGKVIYDAAMEPVSV